MSRFYVHSHSHGASSGEPQRRNSEPLPQVAEPETPFQRERRLSADAVAHAIASASRSAIEAAEKAMAAFEEMKNQKANAERILKERVQLLARVPLFAPMLPSTIEAIAKALEVRTFNAGQDIITQGTAAVPDDVEQACFFIEDGLCYARLVKEGGRWDQVAEYGVGTFFGERAILYNDPQEATITARSTVKALRLTADAFAKVIRERDHKESLLRGCKVFETMPDDKICLLAGLLERKSFIDGQVIIVQGTQASHFYLVDAGEAVATHRDGDSASAKEVTRYHPGDLFGEKALLDDRPRATTITAVGATSTLMLSRDEFEKKLGHLNQLQAQQYVDDPRKLIYDFYCTGDSRGPAGSLAARGLAPNANEPTSWFAVYRPCDRDSIAKMLGKTGVGKGLNIKGKSAKKDRLSGFVPFVQISLNEHKAAVEASPKDARTKMFYQQAGARDTALAALTAVLAEGLLQISEPQVRLIRDFEPDAFGLDVPEPLVREVYIIRPDVSPIIGWETGRQSDPAFMDLNLHAARGDSSPTVVVYQADLADPMNPRGLLLAHAETHVTPVVSDFDAFTVGSRGMRYDATPPEQLELANWALDHAARLLSQPSAHGWMERWGDVIKAEAAKGFGPDVPPFGFGDATSYALMEDAVGATARCGAVRHGAECFNFYFPQELDAEYLVVWEGFAKPPWRSLTEAQLRAFLLERIHDGFTFPLNPVWSVRDPGWYDLLQALRASDGGAQSLGSWFPPESNVLERIDAIRAAHPDGFTRIGGGDAGGGGGGGASAVMTDLSMVEFADVTGAEAERVLAEARSGR